MTTDPFTEAEVERAAQAAHDAQCMCDKGPTLGDQAAARAVLATIEPIRAQAKAEALREAADRVQRHVYDLQCPTSARGYVKGARMAHRWWETVLGVELGRLRELPDEIEEAKSDG